MNRLMIGGALLLTAAFTQGFAQETPLPEITVHSNYAVNTGTNTNMNADHWQDGHTTARDRDDDAARTRTISKTFPADRSDKIVLSNMYGSMTIKTWDRKEVKIDITIKAFSNSEKEAQNLIDQVDINADKTGDIISCKTKIEDGRSLWTNGNRRREIKVGYVVYLPASNSLNLSQQFGNVNMGDFSGPLNAKVQYGDFNAGSLSDLNNYVSVQYGKTNIQELNKATIKQQYGSGLTIGSVGTLDLNAQYAAVDITAIRGDATIKQQYGSGLKIGSVNNLDLDVQYATVNVGTVKGNAMVKQQYNALTLGSVGRLNLRSQYTGVTIGTLKGDGNLKMSYNHFTVSEINPGCKRLVVDADYVNITLGFTASFNGDFSLQKSYGNFRYDNNTRVTSQGDDDDNRHSSTKHYTGKIGNGGSSTVQIDASYGNVSFK